ncbi:MAG: hypothetical protein LUH18_07205 [Oscillospiraceae bacterium]|nr:hypothetical protein [Oscillospiraceae bacterium]
MKKSENLSGKKKMKHRNLTAIIVGFVSFCVLFFGMSLVRENNEISTSDFPTLSTMTQSAEAVTTSEPDTTDIAITTSPEIASDDSSTTDATESVYVLNTSTKKFHRPDCRHVGSIKDENKEEYNGNREDLIEQGYSPCGTCNP